MSDLSPASSPPEVFPAKPPPSYRSTLILAVGFFVMEAFITGSGLLSLFLIMFVIPVIGLRALWAWKNRPLMKRRIGSAAIYFIAGVASIIVVQMDQDGAQERAGQVIAACEAYKKSKGGYPEKLADLVPEFVSSVPKARLRGSMTPRDFTYIVGGPNGFVQTTNAHVLIYTVVPPNARRYYVFEENRWGSYD